MFQVSDSRDINYANAPGCARRSKVYSLAGVEELTGGEISYTLPLGVTHLTVTGYGGNSFFDQYGRAGWRAIHRQDNPRRRTALGDPVGCLAVRHRDH